MTKFFAPISEKDLAVKILSAIENSEESKYIQSSDFDASADIYFLYSDTDWKDLTPQIKVDLKNVEFDLENTELIVGNIVRPASEMKRIMGFQTLSNGMTFLGIIAGGDWEFPIYFIIYWDGSELRGYIPKDGNSWNPINHKAIGNDQEADANYLKKLNPPFCDKEDYADSGDFSGFLWIVPDKIITDINEQILPKL
ncbi:MAG: hypothetical protein WC375_12165 [Methanomassiliicoccales archaeon]|jgi:hypothetical protein